MDLSLVLSFILLFCSLQDLALARDDPGSDKLNLGFSFKDLINPPNRNVKFYFYNRQNDVNPDVFNSLDRRRSLFLTFKHDKPLKVIIHGWHGSDDKRFCKNFREGLLKNENVNVITVDWSENGSKNLLYPISRKRVPEVASVVAEFLDSLNRQYGVKLEDIHVLGHSLGAHVAGLAGNKVETGKIGRITGLDPAGPLFSVNKPHERLSNNSALFVDVIHTCGKYLGMDEPIGHADFYPNGGNFIQPGCALDIAGSCSHRRAYFLYIESLANREAFPAVVCDSWKDFKDEKENCDISNVAYMGEGLPSRARGIYYLKTNKKSPYGLGLVSSASCYIPGYSITFSFFIIFFSLQ